MTDFDWLKFSMNVRMSGDATYPEWLKINSFLEIIFFKLFKLNFSLTNKTRLEESLFPDLLRYFILIDIS